MRRVSLQVSISLLGLFLLAGGIAGQRDRQPGRESSPVLRQAISDAARKYNIPGIAAALIQNGQLAGLDVFGVRDKNSNAPVTPDTLVPASALGEPVYAYAVLRLSAEGRFNVGAPLPSLFPLPYVRDLDPTSALPGTEQLYDPLFNQVTAIRVMNHTSGLADWSRNQHLRFQTKPGQKWSYSNEGYIYLQRIVEHVTGESFNDFVTREILGPAGMRRSGFVWRDANASEMAAGYDSSGARVETHKYAKPAAASTFYTSIREYSQFIRFLLASAPAQRTHESAVSLMLNPTVSVNDAVPFSWGLGVGIEKSGENVFFFQRGNTPGFQCFVIASRKSGSGIVILTNSDKGLDAVPDIVQATVGGAHPILRSDFVHVP